MTFVLLAQVAATWAMVGVIWFAQIVHYPLLDRIGANGFVDYQVQNMRWTSWVVGPLMLVESVTALLLAWNPPAGILPFQAWGGVALLGVIWLSTACLQVPRHKVLALGFEPGAHRALVESNWIRAVAWSARGLLVLWMLTKILK